jgi:hypothetical protein
MKGAIDGMLIEHSQHKGTSNPHSFTEPLFSTLVSKFPTTKLAQRIGSVGSGKQEAQNGKSSSVNGKKGGNDIYVDSVGHLGYHKDWNSLTDAQQQRLNDERDKHGLTGGNKEKGQNVSYLYRMTCLIFLDCHWKMLPLLFRAMLWYPLIGHSLPLNLHLKLKMHLEAEWKL